MKKSKKSVSYGLYGRHQCSDCKHVTINDKCRKVRGTIDFHHGCCDDFREREEKELARYLDSAENP